MNNFIEWLEVRDKSFLDSIILSEAKFVRGAVYNSILSYEFLVKIINGLERKTKTPGTLPSHIKDIETQIRAIKNYLEANEFVTEEDWKLFANDINIGKAVANNAHAYVSRLSYFYTNKDVEGSDSYPNQVSAIQQICDPSTGPGIGFLEATLPQVDAGKDVDERPLNISGSGFLTGNYNLLVWENKAKANAYRAKAKAAGGNAEEDPVTQEPKEIPGIGDNRFKPRDLGGSNPNPAPVPRNPDATINPKGNVQPDQPKGTIPRRQGKRPNIQKPAEPEVPDIFGPKNQKGNAIEETYKKLDMSKSPDPLKQAAGELFNAGGISAYYDGIRKKIALVKMRDKTPVINNNPNSSDYTKPNKQEGQLGTPVIVTPVNDEPNGIAQAIMKAWEDSHGGNPINLAALGNPWKGKTKPDGQPIEFSDDVLILNRSLRPGETYPDKYVVSNRSPNPTISRNNEVPTVYNKQLGARVPQDTQGYQGPQMIYNQALNKWVPYKSPFPK